MNHYDVIPSRRWQRDDGRTASPYGAVPWTNATESLRWELKTIGWTVYNNHRGTVGIGRQPWPTEAEAQAWADEQNARYDAARIAAPI